MDGVDDMCLLVFTRERRVLVLMTTLSIVNNNNGEKNLATEMKTWDEVRDRATLLHTVRKPYDHRTPVARYMYGREENESYIQRLGGSRALEVQAMLAGEVSQNNFSVTSHAESQLMSKIRYPRQLLGRLPHNNVIVDVNWLMQHGVEADNNAFFRFIMNPQTERHVLRSVHGSAYQPIDDMDLLMHIDEYLKGAQVVYDGFGEHSTHLTAIWPDNPIPGGLVPGIHVANSEVGLRSISLGAVLYRESCANILPGYYDSEVKDAMQYEGGNTIKARLNRKGYSGNMSNQWRFRHTGKEERLIEWIKLAMDDLTIQWDTTIAKWNAGLSKLVEDPLEAIAAVSRRASLTQEQLQAALESWAETKHDFGSCSTGIANTFTLGAQQFTNPEHRYGMQHAGSLALSTL